MAGPAPLDDVARDAAIRALARQARAYPDLAPDALDYQLENGPVGGEGGGVPMRPLDVAFAHAIYDAAVRRWLTLAHLLHREIRQGFDALEPRARAVLLAGSAQLLFLDRVPAHGAINHAVEWAKQVIRPGAGGLVNAVLRRIAAMRTEGGVIEPGPWDGGIDSIPLATGGVLRCAGLVLPQDELDRLAIATSHPRVLLEHWGRRMSREQVRELALHSLVEPPVLLNVAHAAGGLDDLPAGTLTPHDDPGHRVFVDRGVPLGAMLATVGGVWVQDPSSAGAIRSVAHLRPRLIVDLCAGQGTKTRQLAATFADAKIIATDVDAARFARLKGTFAGSEQTSVMPFAAARDRALMQADLVLLDVPCSNTGVLPRRPEARYRFGTETQESIVGTQRQILADSIPLLNTRAGAKPAILYSTCSLEPEENTEQGAWIRQWHRFGVECERSARPAGEPGGPPSRYHDGAYSVLLRPG